MAICCTCGNDYEKTFEITMQEKTYEFDCFECAIHRLAPICAHCSCRIIGHGVEDSFQMYCCAHCAEQAGLTLRRKDV